jgi:hypothetical protein
MRTAPNPKEARTNPHLSTNREEAAGTDPGDTHLEAAAPSREGSGAPLGPAKRRGEGRGGGRRRKEQVVVLVAGAALLWLASCFLPLLVLRAEQELSLFSVFTQKKVLSKC